MTILCRLHLARLIQRFPSNIPQQRENRPDVTGNITMYKNINSLILLILTLLVTQGCKDSLEKAYSLGDNIDPDDPASKYIVAGAAPKKPVIRCNKELAFGYYCLGSDINKVLKQRKPLRQHTQDALLIYDFRERRTLTNVSTFQGKILSASRMDRPANLHTLVKIRQRIEMLYGKADDKSTFASTTSTARAMEYAVYNKRAKAHYVWRMPGWRIDLIWDNIHDIRVTFLDEDLNKTYLASQNRQPSKP
jgi:hypothetical protein